MPADGDQLGELVHALRTPLTIVEGFADALATRGEQMPIDEHDEYVQRIGEAAREMRDLLDSARR
jgi:signal transduction histidine kinase